MTPRQISVARKAGAFRALLAGEDQGEEFVVPEGEGVPRAGETFGSYKAYLRSLDPHTIVEARSAGKLPNAEGGFWSGRRR